MEAYPPEFEPFVICEMAIYDSTKDQHMEKLKLKIANGYESM